MTDRIHALTVVLHEDMRDDEIGPLLTAISLLSPVVDVRPHVEVAIQLRALRTGVPAGRD